jgi:hypothetical protein
MASIFLCDKNIQYKNFLQNNETQTIIGPNQFPGMFQISSLSQEVREYKEVVYTWSFHIESKCKNDQHLKFQIPSWFLLYRD